MNDMPRKNRQKIEVNPESWTSND